MPSSHIKEGVGRAQSQEPSLCPWTHRGGNESPYDRRRVLLQRGRTRPYELDKIADAVKAGIRMAGGTPNRVPCYCCLRWPSQWAIFA